MAYKVVMSSMSKMRSLMEWKLMDRRYQVFVSSTFTDLKEEMFSFHNKHHSKWK